jgi:hypothetical protein
MATLIAAVLSLFNVVFRGYLVKTFWGWFVLSQFPMLPKISTLAAIGFIYFVSCVSNWRQITARDLTDSSSEYKGFSIMLINQVLITVTIVVSLGVGWVVHAFM